MLINALPPPECNKDKEKENDCLMLQIMMRLTIVKMREGLIIQEITKLDCISTFKMVQGLKSRRFGLYRRYYPVAIHDATSEVILAFLRHFGLFD